MAPGLLHSACDILDPGHSAVFEWCSGILVECGIRLTDRPVGERTWSNLKKGAERLCSESLCAVRRKARGGGGSGRGFAVCRFLHLHISL